MLWSLDEHSMYRQIFRRTRKPLGHRLVSSAALGLYVFALVVMPSLHVHGCGHGAGTCCEHSAPDLLDSEGTCSICEFAHLMVPCLVISEPLLLQAEVVFKASFTASVPLVAETTVLPPCRAPPVF